MHELELSSDDHPTTPLPIAAYITLTYDDEHLPENYQLEKRHWQLFAKKLRHHIGPFRFLACGEYGEATAENDFIARPHFHAIIYGHDFRFRDTPLERIYYKKNEQGNPLFSSPLLTKVWEHGFNVIGSVTFDSVSYVAGYIQKKINGKNKAAHYRTKNRQTGKYFDRNPEFGLMSRGDKSKDPITGYGLGHGWISKYHTDVYPLDQVVINGQLASPPDYYDRWYEKHYPTEWEEVKKKRRLKAPLYELDNSPERLAAKKKCFIAKHRR